jgi:hypothetical protein
MWEQVLRNLIHLCTALHKDPKLVKDEEVVAAEEDADKEADEDEEQEEAEEEEEVEEEGLAHEDAKKPAHVAANRRQPDDEDKEEEAAEAEWGKQNGTKKVNLTEGIKPHGEGGGAGAADEELEIVEPVRAVKWLFQRLSHIARRNNGQRRSCVFQVARSLARSLLHAELVSGSIRACTYVLAHTHAHTHTHKRTHVHFRRSLSPLSLCNSLVFLFFSHPQCQQPPAPHSLCACVHGVIYTPQKSIPKPIPTSFPHSLLYSFLRPWACEWEPGRWCHCSRR